MSNRLYNFLFESINPSIVSVFRIIFGSFMIYQMFSYFSLDYTYQFMAGPEILFPYRGFTFLEPLPLGILKGIHVGLLISAVLITLGFWYRYAMIFFFLGFSYFSFIDKTLFNNHIYLISLLAFVLIFIEADKKYSLRSKRSDKKLSDKIPAWNQYILIFLISLPYFFGGIAKLSSNWLNTNLTQIMITESKDSFLKDFFSENILINMFTYGGIIYDLSIVFLLLYKRTRMLGVLLVIIFNYANNTILFNDIGIFPMLMVSSTILFFNASKAGKFIDSLFAKKKPIKLGKIKSVRSKKKIRQKQSLASSQIMVASGVNQVWSYRRKITGCCIGLFVIFHLLIPFRYVLLTDNPEWTGLGSRFAWRMKMQSREIKTFNMTLTDRISGASGEIDFRSFLSANQLIHIVEDPYNFIHFAKYLHPMVEKKYGIDDPKITVEIKVSFNGLQTQYMISPTADLIRLDESPFAENSWITPFKKNSQ